MKRISKILSFMALPAAVVLLACACNDGLDIRQDYGFDLETMPVGKRITENETAEIRCRLVKEGNYTEARYHIRFFQTDGRGELKMEDGTLLLPNDLYPLTKEVFRLYYTSRCADQQTIDVYIEDGFGQVVQKTFSWQNEGTDDEKPE